MNIQINDLLMMKKNHPCGQNRFLVLRTGADLKLRCLGCGREFLTPRIKIEKYIKSIAHEEEAPCS